MQYYEYYEHCALVQYVTITVVQEILFSYQYSEKHEKNWKSAQDSDLSVFLGKGVDKTR